MATELHRACAEHPTELVALRWRTARYYTWVHGALIDPAHRYSAPRKTLCGKRVYDAMGETMGGREAIDCGACLRVLARRER